MTEATHGAPAAAHVPTPASMPAPAPAPAAPDLPAGTAPAPAVPPPPESLLAVPADEQGEAADSAPGAGDAPPSYEPFTLPEELPADEAGLAEAQALFAEARLPQATAQKLVDLYAARLGDLVKRQTEAGLQRNAQWIAEVKADPELGGRRFTAAREAARAALQRFGTPELRRSLDELWVGNNPHLFRFFAKVGQAMRDQGANGGDSWFGANDARVDRRSPAEILYPDHNRE